MRGANLHAPCHLVQRRFASLRRAASVFFTHRWMHIMLNFDHPDDAALYAEYIAHITRELVIEHNWSWHQARAFARARAQSF